MITILGYHEIGGPGETSFENPLSIGYEQFDTHLALARGLGLETRHLSGIADGEAHDGAGLAVTFDDGHVSGHATAAALLDKHGFRGTFFITTAHVDSGPQWLTSAQIRDLDHAGMEIGSHTHSHAYLDDLDDAAIAAELTRSKQILDDIVGRETRVMSCPGGRYDRRLARIARETGYRVICTSVPGHNRRPQRRPVAVLDRYILRRDLGIEAYSALIARRNPERRERLAYRAKRVARRVMGNRAYQALWERVRR